MDWSLPVILTRNDVLEFEEICYTNRSVQPRDRR